MTYSFKVKPCGLLQLRSVPGLFGPLPSQSFVQYCDVRLIRYRTEDCQIVLHPGLYNKILQSTSGFKSREEDGSYKFSVIFV